MSLLKKIGSLLASANPVIAIVAGLISPLIAQAKQGQAAKVTATIQNDISVLGGIIANVDAVGQSLGLTGAQKFQAALPQIGKAIAGTALLANHKIANQALYDKAVAEYTQATVDLLNALHDDGVDTQSAN